MYVHTLYVRLKHESSNQHMMNKNVLPRMLKGISILTVESKEDEHCKIAEYCDEQFEQRLAQLTAEQSKRCSIGCR